MVKKSATVQSNLLFSKILNTQIENMQKKKSLWHLNYRLPSKLAFSPATPLEGPDSQAFCGS
jgi:hypothetical protein